MLGTDIGVLFLDPRWKLQSLTIAKYNAICESLETVVLLPLPTVKKTLKKHSLKRKDLFWLMVSGSLLSGPNAPRAVTRQYHQYKSA